MRIVKSIPDVQKALNELFNYVDRDKSKTLDMKGRQIKNGAPSTDPSDFVTRSELSGSSQSWGVTKYEYTIVFSKDSPTDDDFSPPFFIGLERDGFPAEVWLSPLRFPNSADLTIDILVDYEDGDDPVSILPMGDTETEYLTIKNGDLKSVWTSKFRDPYPKFPLRAKFYVHVVTAGGAEMISIGVIVKRRRNQSASNGRN